MSPGPGPQTRQSRRAEMVSRLDGTPEGLSIFHGPCRTRISGLTLVYFWMLGAFKCGRTDLPIFLP